MKIHGKYNAVIEQGEDGYLISSVIELPGCHTQAKSYDELMKRTKEAISLGNDISIYTDYLQVVES